MHTRTQLRLALACAPQLSADERWRRLLAVAAERWDLVWWWRLHHLDPRGQAAVADAMRMLDDYEEEPGWSHNAIAVAALLGLLALLLILRRP